MRSAKRKDVFIFLIPAFLVACSAMAVSLWEFVTMRGSTVAISPESIVGSLLILCGLTTNIVAAVTLRRFYSATLVIREDHQLITHGIYRHTRHPIYLGTIVATLGMPLCLSSLYGFIAMSVLIPLFLLRIRLEERMLTEEFGAEYRAYKDTTSRLIPYVF